MRGRVCALAAGLGLAAVLAVFAAAPAAAQSVSIISTPANGTHYVLGEEIRTRITHGQVFGVAGGAWNTIFMRINIGGTVRQASIREGYRVRATSHTFRYVVTRNDVDTDGITIPANSIGGPSWRSFGFGTVNRNHGALNNQAAHKVIGSEARVTSSNPGWLTWPTLNTATLTVTLTGSTFGSSVAASNFTINASPAITGLSISGASATSGGTTATLTLGYTGSTTLTGDRTFTVTVAAAAHAGTIGLTTNAVTVGTIPTPTLAISPTSIAENGGVATVTATLDKTLIQPVTVTATAEAGTNAAAGDFTQTGTTLTFAAGTTASTGLITLTAVDDDTDGPNKTVRVTGSSASGSQARSPSDATMTITDDDATPTPTLVLSATSISENGGMATVTARLSHPSAQPTTVTLTAAAQGGLQASDYTQAGSSTLTIAAGATTTTDNRRFTAVDNDVDAPDKSLRISATVANGHGAGTAQNVTLTFTDDEATATATLVLDPASISENGGLSTVTARLSHPASEATTLTVSATAVSPALQADFTRTGSTLTIAAGVTTSAGLVTVTAVDNSAAEGSKRVTVAASADGGHGVAAPSSATLTIRDDEHALDVSAVSGQATEAGGQSTFTVALTTQPSAAVTVAVTSRDTDEGTVEPASLVFTTGAWDTAQTVTVTGANDDVDDGTVTWQVRLDPASGDTNYNGLSNVDVDVTTTDDDPAPGVVLSLDPTSIAESGTGNLSTVTARLSRPSGAATTVTVTVTAGAGAGGPIVIAAGQTTGTTTVTATDNETDAPDRTATISATVANARAAADSTTMAVTDATLTITDDEAAPGVTLALDPASIAEPSGVSTVSATLSHPSSQPSTVTVTAVSGAYTAGTDATIVIAAGATTAASDTATIRVVDDDLHHGNAGRSATVTAAHTNGQGAGAVTGAALTITDDENLPTASLLIDPLSSQISENGGIATVTAQLAGLSGKSSEATTLTVTVTAVASSGAVAGDFTQSGTTLTVAAGSRTSTGLVTITGVDNNVDAANKLLRISATAAGGNGIQNPGLTVLTLTDDDAAPTASLVLTPPTILENGGISTVTAKLSHPTTMATVTLTVTTTAVSPTVAADFTQSSTDTLTIAASATTSTGLVTVTAVDNNVAAGNKQVRVAATAAGGGVANPSAATLILRDDEFGLEESAVSGQATEAGGQATFTVALRTQPTAAVTVSVTSQDPGEGTVEPSSLTFTGGATGNWNTAQTVTVTGVDDDVDDGTVTWQVRLDPASGDTNYDGLANVDVDVTTTDNDAAPTATLSLNPTSVAENGGVSTVTARLSHPSVAATTLTVTAVSGAFTAGSGAAGVIVIAANATTSTDTATVTAVDNTTDEPGRTATVTATMTNDQGAGAVTGATLTLTDDDGAPGVVLSVNPSSVSENGGASAVSATLSHPSSEPSTVTVTAVAGAYTVGSDATITIAAGSTTAASDTAAIAGVNDDVHQGTAGRSVTVTASLTNGQGAGAVTGAALTLTDDETLPVASLALGPASVSENGGVSTVTAALSGPSSQATTLTVSSSAVSSSGAVAGDFTQSGTTLTIAAGATTSTGAVTVRGNDNDVDAANKSVTVSATATGGNGVAAPSAATLTLADDEATATATLVLTPSAILENGEVSTVTARLSHPTTEATTLTVSTVPVSPAVAGDFNLSATTTLTIAAGGTTSTGLVTVTAVDNAVASGRKRVTVSATAAGGLGVAAPSDATLTIRDDEFGLDESTVTGQATEGGGQATFTVALQTQPSAAVTVSVTRWDAAGLVEDESEGRVSPSRLVFTVQNWETAQTVTVTGADDDVDDGDVAWKVRLEPSSGDVNYDGLDPVDVDVTTTDNDGPPTVTLELDPASISEASEVSTVTAVLSHPSVKLTTVTVEAAPVSPAVAGDFMLSSTDTLTIAAGATTSTGTVTITAEDNAVDAPDKTVTISGDAENSMGVGAVESATLTITDDDEKGLAFAVGGTSVTVLAVTAGQDETTYTVKLTSEPSGTVTVAVAGSPASRIQVIRPEAGRLTFPASAWNTAQPVTVRVAANEGGYAAPLALAHDASGSDYEDVATKSLDVSVEGETKLRVAPGRTMAPVVINGYRVTMTAEAGVPPGIEIDLSDLLPPASGGTEDLDLEWKETVEESVLEKVSAARFGLGPAASRTVVDVAVTEGTVPSPGLRLCLPVVDAVQEAARGRPLLLLHYDGSAWDDVDGSAPSPDGTMVCASGVREFSPFAVGYADTKPVLDDFTQRTLVFTVDEAIEPVTLPKAEGGDGDLTYALSPVLPVGLTVDLDTRVLSGTPTEEFDETTYTWKVTDLDRESQKDEKTFTIEVIRARAEALARLKAINESILPELSRAQWGSVVEAVTGRLEAPGTGGGMVASVAEALKAQEGTQDDLSWREALAGRTFALGLGDGDIDISDFDSLYGGGGHGVVFWGSGEQRALSLEKEALSWSGEAYTALVGTDGQLTRTLRAGVAASWFESYIDYTDKSGDDAIKGAHESRMQAIHPYLGWSGDGGSRVWAVLGYGVGEIEIVDAEIVERFGVQRSDSRLLAAAAGGSVRAVSEGALTVDVKGALEGTQYSVEANGEQGVIEAVSVETHRLRLSVEGSRSYALGGGGSLTPSLEVGVRWDGGDGETGTGVEVGGGMSWRSASGAVSVEARGRGLLTHESGLNEWGAGGAVRLGAVDDGYGLSLSVLPSWGSVESGVSRLWEEGVTGRAPGASSSGARLAAELGYGFGVFEGAGVATPYLGFGYENGGDRRYRVGTRLGLGDTLDLTLEAERKEADTPNHGAHIDLRVIW